MAKAVNTRWQTSTAGTACCKLFRPRNCRRMANLNIDQGRAIGIAMRIGFMGAGRMATALARGLVSAEIVSADSIVATDPSADARHAFQIEVPSSHAAAENVAKVAATDVIFLAVKPQQMHEALASLRESISANAL